MSTGALIKPCYLALEKGTTQKTIRPLLGITTIGRAEDNTIVIPDPTISRHHAKISVEDGVWVLEDLGSANGISVDGKNVEKAILKSEKSYCLGKTTVRLIEQKDCKPGEQNFQTAEILSCTFDNLGLLAEKERAKPWSKSLTNAIREVPFLSSLWEAELMKLANAASLHLFREGEKILSAGDRGRSIYVILDGRARVVTRDHYARILELAILEVSDFFGEMSFLTGEPRSADVEALVATLCIEINYSSLRNLIRDHPAAKKILMQYYSDRLGKNEKKFAEMGVKQRRGYPRLNEALPVNIVRISRTKGQGKGSQMSWKNVHSIDVSMSGIKVALPGTAPEEFHRRDQFRLEIELPSPWKKIYALGHIRQIKASRDGKKMTLLGIKFDSLTAKDAKKLNEFIYGDTHVES